MIFSTASVLDQVATPACPTDYGERITHILLSKTAVTATGNIPTAAEFTTAYDAGLLLMIHVTSCHKTQIGESEIEIIEKENYDKKYRVEGKIYLLSEAIARACERVTRYSQLYLYYYTDKQYCFGGYKATPDFSLRIGEGSGSPVYIKFMLDFFPGIDYAAYDQFYGVDEPYTVLTDDSGTWLTTDGGVILTI